MKCQAKNLAGKGFNVKISFDENGAPVIGTVLGFFSIDADCYDIKPVNDETVIDIANALGIVHSSKSLLLNKKLKRGKKAQAKPRKALEKQLDIVFLPGVGQSIVENFFEDQQVTEPKLQA